jgi:GntR family transcriptional repressor for pyruvate dehydrogenase complex
MSEEPTRRRDGVAVTDGAIDRIRAMIVSGELMPGDRLPKEDELAAQLGLSRSSLREAVRALALVHILDVRQGDGTYVTSLSPKLLLDAVSFVIDFHRDDSVLEFLEVRRILEPAATAMAARRISDEQVGELRQLLEQVPPESDVEDFVANDLAFHRAVASHCGNTVLAALLDSMSGTTNRARIWRGVTDEHARERTLGEHRAIVDALARHQPEIAAARATVHIAGVEDWLFHARLEGVSAGSDATSAQALPGWER